MRDASPADLSRPEAIASSWPDYDLVLGALPSVLGYQTLEAVIEAGKDYCDISFMPENALELDAPARAARGVRAVVDCGVAPGVSNMMAGYAAPAPRAVREPRDLRGRPAARAALALRLQGGLRALRRDRGVHATGARSSSTAGWW